MFEQSILIERPGKTGWSVLVSAGFQLVGLSILAMMPLLFTEHLSPLQWTRTLVAPAPPPPPAPVVETNAPLRTSPSSANTRVFARPIKIPDHLAMSSDPVALPTASIGVPFASGAVTAVGNLIGDLLHAAPLPPPLTSERSEVEAGKPLPVSGGVQSAKLIRRVLPVYPALARQARISGTVRLVGIIGRDGTIQRLQLVSGPALLVGAALNAVKQWLYQPTLLSGQPVEVFAPIDVVFTLN